MSLLPSCFYPFSADTSFSTWDFVQSHHWGGSIPVLIVSFVSAQTDKAGSKHNPLMLLWWEPYMCGCKTKHVWKKKWKISKGWHLMLLVVTVPPISQKDGRLRQGALEGPIVEEHQGTTVGINQDSKSSSIGNWEGLGDIGVGILIGAYWHCRVGVGKPVALIVCVQNGVCISAKQRGEERLSVCLVLVLWFYSDRSWPSVYKTMHVIWFQNASMKHIFFLHQPSAGNWKTCLRID